MTLRKFLIAEAVAWVRTHEGPQTHRRVVHYLVSMKYYKTADEYLAGLYEHQLDDQLDGYSEVTA